MQPTTQTERFPELREFIKEHDQGLYDFCYYVGGRAVAIEEVLLGTLREFGELFRLELRKEQHWNPLIAKVRLYRLTWHRLREGISASRWNAPQAFDVRTVRAMEDNVLNRRLGEEGAEAVADRFRSVDLECRCAIYLKDRAALSDEEILQILGVRWGVYRHRLHRGRIEFRDLLKGSARDKAVAGRPQLVPV